MLKQLMALVAFSLVSMTAYAAKDPAKVAPKPMSNQDVIALVEAGLGESIVVEKIRTSKTAFDTSTEALVALKKAGIPSGVIRLMVNPEAKDDPVQSTTPWPSQSQTPEECKAGPGGNLPWLAGASPAMWYADAPGAERIEIQYERGTLHRVGFAGIGATLLLLKPINATLRLKPATVFYSCINPSDAPLVEFSLDKDDNERNTSVARGGPWNQSFRIAEDDIVPISFKKLPQGYFEITPKTALETGEYGFVPQGSVGYFAAGERVYAFGVD